MVFDSNDGLKSMTCDMRQLFDYEILGHREGDLVQLSILKMQETEDALRTDGFKRFCLCVLEDTR